MGLMAARIWSVQPPMGLQARGDHPCRCKLQCNAAAAGTAKASLCTTKVEEEEQGTGEPA